MADVPPLEPPSIHAALAKHNNPALSAALERGDPVGALSYEVALKGFAAPLHVAALRGDAEAVRQLLRHKAPVGSRVQRQSKPSAEDEEAGATPLYLAAHGGHLETVRALLVARPDGYARCHGRTALYAAGYNGHAAVCTALLQHGCNPNSQPADGDGATALIAASEGGHADAARALLSMDTRYTATRRADLRLARTDGASALWAAAAANYAGLVTLLCERGVDCDQPNGAGESPAFAAAQLGAVEALRALSALGADLARPRFDGATPFWIGCRCGQAAAVEFLVEVLASVPSEAQVAGWTPYAIASKHALLPVLRVLRGLGVNERAVLAANDDCTRALRAGVSASAATVRAPPEPVAPPRCSPPRLTH